MATGGRGGPDSWADRGDVRVARHRRQRRARLQRVPRGRAIFSEISPSPVDARASGEISEADLVDSVRNNESLRRLFGDVAIGRPEAQKWLSEIDLDGSGAISFAEFRAYMLTQLHNYQTASPNSRAPAYATDGRGFFFAASASPSSSASPKAGFAGPAVIEEHEFRSPSSSADTRPGVCSVCGGHGGSHEGYCPLA